MRRARDWSTRQGEKLAEYVSAFVERPFEQEFAIADKESLDAAGGDSLKMSDEANGTGPFKVVS